MKREILVFKVSVYVLIFFSICSAFLLAIQLKNYTIYSTHKDEAQNKIDMIYRQGENVKKQQDEYLLLQKNSANNEIIIIKKQNDELIADNKKLLIEKKQIEEEINQLSAFIKNNDNLKNNLDTLILQINDKKRELKEINDNYTNLNIKKSKLDHEYQFTLTQYDELQKKDLNNVKLEINNLEIKTQTFNNNLVNLQNQKNSLNLEINSLQKELNSVQTTLNLKNNEIKNSNIKNTKLQNDISSAITSYNEQLIKYNDIKTTNENLNLLLSKTQSNQVALEQNILALTQQKKELSEEVNNLDTLYKEKQQQITNINNDVVILVENKKSLDDEYLKLNIKKAELVGQISELQNQYQNLQKEIHNKNIKLQEEE